MKRIYKLLSLPIILLFGSCLSEDPKGLMQEENAYKSASDVELNCVASLYNYIGGNSESQGLQGTYRGVYDWNSLTTDEQMLPVRGGDWYDGGFWQRLYYHTWTASDNALEATWNYLYKVVALCNRSLHQIELHQNLLSSSQYAACTAEVRALRAIYYWYIMDMWGAVPVVIRYDTQPENVEQSSRSEVWRFVVSELQAVAPYLSTAHSNLNEAYYGRITQPVAHFVLAKLALNAAVYANDNWTDGRTLDGGGIMMTVDNQQMNAWQATLHYCRLIEDNGYTQLATDYASNFAVHNETSVENIFTIPMDKVLYANQFRYLFRSRHSAHGSAIGMDAENGTVATTSTVRTYGYDTPSVDARWHANFYADTLQVGGSVVTLDNGQPLVYLPLAVTAYDLTGTPQERTAGARMAKYEIDLNAYADGNLQSNDIVLFRYADVVLMEAEAKVRDGQNGDSDLNRVRQRVGMDRRTATLDNILQERLLELMWEGWRRQDLIRFGRFTMPYDLRTDVSSEADNHTTVFPIPASVLEQNSRLSQNPGY